MNNVKLIICQVFIVIFIVLSAVMGALALSSLGNVLRLNSLYAEISELSSLNAEFDFYVLNSSLYSNFDDINKKIVQIGKANDKIKSYNTLDIVDDQKLDQLFAAKHRLAISLVSSSASLLNIQTAAITLGSKAAMDTTTHTNLNKIIVLTNDLYFQTMQSEDNIKTIKSLISSIKVQEDDFSEKIKEKMLYALSTMMNIKLIKDSIEKDYFTAYVEQIKKDIDQSFHHASSELYKYSTYLAVCVFGLIMLSVVLSVLVNIANNRNSIIIEVFRRLPLELIIFNKNQKPFFVNNRAQERHKFMHENHAVVPYFDFEDKMQNELVSNGVYIDNVYQPSRASRIFRLSIFKMPENINKIKNYFLCKIDITGEKAEASKLKSEITKLTNNFNIDKLTGLGSPQALDEKLATTKTGIVVYITLKHFDNMRFYYKASVIDSIIQKFAHSLQSYADEYGIAITASDYEMMDEQARRLNEHKLMEKRLFRIHLDEFCFWVDNEEELEVLNKMLNDKYKEPFELVNIDDLASSINNLEIRYGISQPTDTNTNRLNQAILASFEAEKLGELCHAYSSALTIEEQYIFNQNMIQIIKYALNEQHGCKVFLQCQGIHQISSMQKSEHTSYADFFAKGLSEQEDEKEGQVCYYECLVRIMDEDGKIWYPNAFLDIAKQSSLYTKITLKIMELVFDLISRTDAHFSINLSSIDMVDKEVKERFAYYLSLHHDKASNLCIEILESESVGDYESIKSFIKMAKKAGCKIAIDDFGSGFSNYYRLLEVDLDYLKIDGSIIQKLPTDNNAIVALRSIVDFAYSQNYDVVAEFVSDENVLSFVRALGITKVQGWAFSKPRNATDLF